MKIKELKNMKEGDLQHLLSETRNKLRELRFKDSAGQLKDVREIRENKKLVARTLTLLNLNKQK
ncbi:MAG: 50S ribosomal protein L29 [Patescibacteria group bacterium]|nr:50S ribosomal protein L29 [Patescibacteria group bacterium]